MDQEVWLPVSRKWLMAKMWLSDTTMYITTHDKLSANKTVGDTKIWVSYTTKYVTAKDVTILQ